MTSTPYIELLVLYEPTTQTTVIQGTSSRVGTDRILISSGMTPQEQAIATTLARNNEAMSPQAKSGSLVNKSGPGFRPQSMSPPRSTAPVPEPGMPRARSGANEPAAAALLAASQDAIPSTAPVPRGSSLLKDF